MNALDADRVARTYDRIGRLLDSQSFYEDRALDRLIAHAGFEEAQRVLELGCGTGRFAARLLSAHLQPGARYVGLEISPRMVELATWRLLPWAPRAEVRLADGSRGVEEPDDSVDRFVATYVLDLLGDEGTSRVVAEAARVLAPGGTLCVAGLTHGEGPLGRLVSSTWTRVWSRWPAAVGGCRPIAALDRLSPSRWEIRHRSVVRAWGLTSEVVVASPR